VGPEGPGAAAARRRCFLGRALPAGTATDEHRTIVSRLATAKRLLTAGKPEDLKASIAASREARELLRVMRPAAVNSAAQKRDLAEREAVILDMMTELAQALFSYDSAASHIDPHLRDMGTVRLLSPGTRDCVVPGQEPPLRAG